VARKGNVVASRARSSGWQAPLHAQRVLVLCDPFTFSAAFQATFILHEMGASVVGVPPAQAPNAFMEAAEFTLPESRIQGTISIGMQMYVPSAPAMNVLRPDFETTTEIFRRYDLDEDSTLRYALDLIHSGRL